MLGWIADLDDFEIIRTLEDSVTDTRRLSHAISCGEYERLTLVLVDKTYVAASAEDQLESDLMEVHIIGNGTGAGNPDVRRNDGPSLPIRNEISILHTGSSRMPRISRMGERERTHEGWEMQRRCSIDEFDPQAVGPLHRRHCQSFGVRGFDPKYGWLEDTRFEMQTTPRSDESAPQRSICREDPLDAKPQ